MASQQQYCRHAVTVSQFIPLSFQCPVTRLCSSSASPSSFSRSLCCSRETGMAVQRETTVAICSGPTSSVSIGSTGAWKCRGGEEGKLRSVHVSGPTSSTAKPSGCSLLPVPFSSALHPSTQRVCPASYLIATRLASIPGSTKCSVPHHTPLAPGIPHLTLALRTDRLASISGSAPYLRSAMRARSPRVSARLMLTSTSSRFSCSLVVGGGGGEGWEWRS